jgi:hypothetical protein
LYLLAKPGTSEEVRDEIFDRAEAGEAITHKAVKEELKKEQEPEASGDEIGTETESDAEPEAPASDEAGNDESGTETEASDTETEVSPRTKNNKRWFRDVCECAAQAKRFAKVVDNAEPDLAQALREIAEPGLLSTLREGGQALIRLADFLQEERQALAEAAE